MSDVAVLGKTFGRARLSAADGVFVVGQFFMCLGVVGNDHSLGLICLVAVALVGMCAVLGIRDSATALLGGRTLEGGPDPDLSIAASSAVVAAWITLMLGAGVGLSLLDVSAWRRAALLAAGACALIAALRWGRRHQRARSHHAGGSASDA